jgi:hypothetical protein
MALLLHDPKAQISLPVSAAVTLRPFLVFKSDTVPEGFIAFSTGLSAAREGIDFRDLLGFLFISAVCFGG